MTPLELLAAALLCLGTALLLLSAFGVLRMPDIYMRMHAAAKAATLGATLVVAGVGLALGEPGHGRAALICLFLLVTTPLGAMRLAAAARIAGEEPAAETAPDHLAEDRGTA